MENVVAVSAHNSHSMAVTSDGGLWAWGVGLFGDGKVRDWENPALTPVRIMENVIAVSSWNNYTMVITDDNVLWAWGGGGFLGDGKWRDVNPNNIDFYQLTPVRILDDVVYFSASPFNAMAIKNDGSLWAWGAGIIGDGRDHRDWDNAQLTPVHIMDNVTAVSTNGNSAIAITSDGKVWTWGISSLLGDDSNNHRFIPGHILNLDGTPVTYSINTQSELAHKTTAPATSDPIHWSVAAILFMIIILIVLIRYGKILQIK
jgi:alpha-tubulin suppressor-like RCC1 family protein